MRTQAARRILVVLVALGLGALACGESPPGGGAGGTTGSLGEGGRAGAGGGGGTSEALRCFDLLTNPGQGGVPIACCPVTKRNDCSAIADGSYAPGKPGRCVEGPPGTRDFCSCTCTRGEWTCGC